MQLDDVNLSALRVALRDMPKEFRTKDLSEHEAVLQAHQLWHDDMQYHSMIGRTLSNHRVRLHLRLIAQDGNRRGALWQKIGASVASDSPSQANQ